jgi:hypothetical protein
MFFPGDGRPEDRQQDPIPEFRPLMAVDPSSDDLGVDSSQVKRGKDRSHNHHEDEKPAPCPHPGSGRQEQTQDEEEQHTPESPEQATTVDRFWLPWLITIGDHVCYVLSKMGTAKSALGGRFGRASRQFWGSHY